MEGWKEGCVCPGSEEKCRDSVRRLGKKKFFYKRGKKDGRWPRHILQEAAFVIDLSSDKID